MFNLIKDDGYFSVSLCNLIAIINMYLYICGSILSYINVKMQ